MTKRPNTGLPPRPKAGVVAVGVATAAGDTRVNALHVAAFPSNLGESALEAPGAPA